LREDCEVSASMGTNITTIDPSEEQLTMEKTKKVVTKIDNTPPYITDIKVPSGFARNTHSTAIQFTIKDDESGLDGSVIPVVDSWGQPQRGTPKCKFEWIIDREKEDGYLYATTEESIKPANGAKSFLVTKEWTDLFFLDATRIKLEVKLTDMAGNKSTTTIYSEPTKPNETFLVNAANGDYIGDRERKSSSSNIGLWYNAYGRGSNNFIMGNSWKWANINSSTNENVKYRYLGISDTGYPNWKFTEYTYNYNTANDTEKFYKNADGPTKKMEWRGKTWYVRYSSISEEVYDYWDGPKFYQYPGDRSSLLTVDELAISTLANYFNVSP